jgi:hypothetical protein
MPRGERRRDGVEVQWPPRRLARDRLLWIADCGITFQSPCRALGCRFVTTRDGLVNALWRHLTRSGLDTARLLGLIGSVVAGHHPASTLDAGLFRPDNGCGWIGCHHRPLGWIEIRRRRASPMRRGSLFRMAYPAAREANHSRHGGCCDVTERQAEGSRPVRDLGQLCRPRRPPRTTVTRAFAPASRIGGGDPDSARSRHRLVGADTSCRDDSWL